MSGAGQLRNRRGGDSDAGSERSPLLRGSVNAAQRSPPSMRREVFAFLEARNGFGRAYQALVVALIAVNVVCFILRPDASASPASLASAAPFFDALELVTTLIFSADWLARLWTIPEEVDAKTGLRPYQGVVGRLRWALTTRWSLVDLASILPYYVDLALPQNLPATQFVRLLRLFRMMRGKGEYVEALTTFDDIIVENRRLLLTGGFVGFTVWMVISAFYYIAESGNPAMIWKYDGCWAPGDDPSAQASMPACPNRYQSIVWSSYFTLLNLFGEFPLIDNHNTWGRVIGTFTAVVAVAVFAIPTGVVGDGFSKMIEQRKARQLAAEATNGGASRGADASAAPPQSWAARTLDGKGRAGGAYKWAMCVLVTIDVLAFMASTVPSLQQSGGDVAVDALGAFSVLFVAVLTVDWLLRLAMAPSKLKYLVSLYGLVDVASVLPFYVSLIALGGVHPVAATGGSVVWRALRLVRLFKGERYVRGFTVMDDIVRENAGVLGVSGFAAVVVWIFASAVMYFAERHNPDPATRAYYQSVPDAMWITLLNLTGECPLCDYTWAGKIITGLLGLFAVGWFSVPVGLIGAGFEEWVSEIADAEADGDDGGDGGGSASGGGGGGGSAAEGGDGQRESKAGGDGSRAAAVASSDEQRKVFSASPPSLRLRTFNFFEGRTPSGKVFEVFIIGVIVFTVGQAIVQTVHSICPDEEHCPGAFDTLELIAVVIFTAEYFGRVYAAPEHEDYRGWNGLLARARFVFSFYAVIDALAIFPYYIAQVSATVDEYDNYLRLLRLLRLLKVDKYVPSVSLIDDVFRLKARGLRISVYATAVVWALFATALYLTERGNGEAIMAERFRDVPNTLQYDLILLTGDYPIVDFTTGGKLINILQILVAVGVVAVPSGLIAGGFTEVLEAAREEKRSRRRAAAVVLQRTARAHLAVKAGAQQKAVTSAAKQRWTKAMNALDALRRERAERKEREWNESSALGKARTIVFNFVSGATSLGHGFRIFIAALICGNVVAVLLESEPDIGGTDKYDRAFNLFEAFSVIVFTTEYIMRLATAPLSSKYGGSYAGYALSFFGVVDLATILPWYIQTVLAATGTPFDAQAFRVVRMFRLLGLEHFVSAFTLLDDVYRECKSVLAATGLLALIIWVGGSCLFYLFESENEATGGAFSSIPSSMYYVAVFLGGEWGQIDFTPGGKVLCCLFCVLGIALFAIPVGTIFEAFGDVLAELAEGGAGASDGDSDAKSGNDGDDDRGSESKELRDASM